LFSIVTAVPLSGWRRGIICGIPAHTAPSDPGDGIARKRFRIVIKVNRLTVWPGTGSDQMMCLKPRSATTTHADRNGGGIMKIRNDIVIAVVAGLFLAIAGGGAGNSSSSNAGQPDSIHASVSSSSSTHKTAHHHVTHHKRVRHHSATAK
jgi:hypothetical protein